MSKNHNSSKSMGPRLHTQFVFGGHDCELSILPEVDEEQREEKVGRRWIMMLIWNIFHPKPEEQLRLILFLTKIVEDIDDRSFLAVPGFV